MFPHVIRHPTFRRRVATARLRAVHLLIATLVLGGFARPSSAQSVNSSIEGMVEDPSGAVVPGARAILTNVNTAN